MPFPVCEIRCKKIFIFAKFSLEKPMLQLLKYEETTYSWLVN